MNEQYDAISPATETAGNTYTGILKAMALIGGSSVVNIACGIARAKANALFLGPAGVGLMGLYGSIAEVAQSLAGLGVQSSGVRQIAEAVGTGEPERIARTAIVLRRTSLVCAVLGGGLLVSLAGPISEFTFGTRQHATSVAMLSIAVCLYLVAAGQRALILGIRRISDVARIGVIGSIAGTAIGIPLVFFFRERGLVPALIAVSAISLVTSTWYSRSVQIVHPVMSFSDIRREAAGLLKLGVAFMFSAFLTMGAAYLIRIIVLRYAGIAAAGLYQAAWAVGGLYVTFILQAMGADFYPRLSSVCHDNDLSNRFVNEQARVSLLLAGPGVIATMTAAPLVIALFYSAEFSPAVDLLRWLCVGLTLRVIAWPMGYIVLAKGAQLIFLWTELAVTTIHVGLAWLFVSQFGLNGAGAAFVCLYVWHAGFIYVIVRRLTGFRWSAPNRSLGLAYVSLTALVFAGCMLLPQWLAGAVGVLSTIATGIYSTRAIVTLLPIESIPRPVRPWLLRLGWVPQAT
jgi:antigen flippase